MIHIGNWTSSKVEIGDIIARPPLSEFQRNGSKDWYILEGTPDQIICTLGNWPIWQKMADEGVEKDWRCLQPDPEGDEVQ